MVKLRFSFKWVFFLLPFVFGCNHGDTQELNGMFKGMDGSNQTPSGITCRLSVTGDGLVSGTWASEGEIKSAQISGVFGYFTNEILLHVTSGPCSGEFKGTFQFEKGRVTGKFGSNPVCPDRVYSFELQKI